MPEAKPTSPKTFPRVVPPPFLLYGLRSFYTNANAFLFEVAPNWVKTHPRWQPRTTL
jgi:hypothetical protein